VLAVVDDQERFSVPEELDESLVGRHFRVLGDLERTTRRVRDEAGLAQRSELDEPGAVLELPKQLGRHLQRQPGLAHAADAGQRDEPVAPDELGDLLDLSLSSDESAQLYREVVRCALESPQLTCVLGAIAGHAEQSDRLAEILEAVRACVDEGHAVGQAAAQQSAGGLGHQDLASVPGVHDSRRSGDRGAEVVAVARLGLTCVDPDPGDERRPGQVSDP
jgi:hypothetical protein